MDSLKDSDTHGDKGVGTLRPCGRHSQSSLPRGSRRNCGRWMTTTTTVSGNQRVVWLLSRGTVESSGPNLTSGKTIHVACWWEDPLMDLRGSGTLVFSPGGRMSYIVGTTTHRPGVVYGHFTHRIRLISPCTSRVCHTCTVRPTLALSVPKRRPDR